MTSLRPSRLFRAEKGKWCIGNVTANVVQRARKSWVADGPALHPPSSDVISTLLVDDGGHRPRTSRIGAINADI